MSGVGGEEVEYESDPEEVKLSLKMRRREASDDEDEGEERERQDAVRGIDSEEEGAPAEYDEEFEEIEEEYLGEEEELEEEGEYEYERGEIEVEGVIVVEGEGGKEGGAKRLGLESTEEVDERGDIGVNEEGNDNNNNNQQQRDDEKKENEPYAVPTAGAFYMHDDRFRDNAGGRNRRTFGGRKLWESKDDRKWGHDKFEELTMHEREYEEGRRSFRGRNRGRGRGRAAPHGYTRGNRLKMYGNDSNQHNNNQNNPPKTVRGRGPRRYQPSLKNNSDAPPAQKQFPKSVEKPSHTISGRATDPVLNGESGTVPAKKQVFASSLNYASPPFYPSSSSTKEITRDVQSGAINKNVQPPVADDNVPMAQSNTTRRGKNIVDSIGMDRLYIDDSTSGVAGKPSTSSRFPPSGSSSLTSSQPQHLRAQGRGLNSLPLITYRATATNNLVNRVSAPTRPHAVQRNSVQSRVQSSDLQYAQRPGSVSLPSSPPKSVVPLNSVESGDLDSVSESSKSMTTLVGKGKVNLQGSGRESFLYGGAQVMGPTGNVGSVQGDQNITNTPAFLPVMQFGGQHPRGIPAVGMAFPGYVGQPQLGLGNSEMTWLPVLAGAAGALGATYPYIALDGAYHARPSGQTSSLTAASSKDNNIKAGNELKSSQRPEPANDDFGQRQKNPRRYTEMKFDQ